MVKSETKTAFMLLKSTDGIKWYELVKDRIFRTYTSDDGYTFEDKNITNTKTLYHLKIMNASNTTIALSPIVAASIEAPVKNKIPENHTRENYTKASPAASNVPTTETDKATWSIFPNPVRDVLNLHYQGSKPIQGSINLVILDMGGKIVTRFRCASTTRSISIPLDKISGGIYLLQLSVSNSTLLSQRFVKQ